MSSPTDATTIRPELAAAARKAKVRSGLSGKAGFLAMAVGAGLLGLFIWQAGVLAPPAPQDIVTDDKIDKPEQITGLNASIAGRDANNLPYQINAKSGEQDKLVDHIIHMQTVTSVFERPTGAKLDVSSDSGTFDRKSKGLELSGNVVFSEGERFRATMQKAAIDTEKQTLDSQSPVKVDMQGTLIEADSLSVKDNGTRLLFKGGVKAHFEMKSKATGDGG
jgi:lipopolysaccharide export system protein LptC